MCGFLFVYILIEEPSFERLFESGTFLKRRYLNTAVNGYFLVAAFKESMNWPFLVTTL